MADESLVAGDYEYAVIQCLCLMFERRLHLVFASAELLPAELPRPPDEPGTHSAPAQRLASTARLFHSRYVVTAAEARAWYDQCRQGVFNLPGADSARPTEHAPWHEEPTWPQLITGNKFPVWGDTPGATRVHHLYTTSTPPLIERLFHEHPELEKWASDKIFASFLQYPELAGSVHLLVPNPVYRSLKVRLNVAQDGAESTVVEVTPRAGKSPKGLQVLLFEHRPSGISSVQTQNFGQRPYLMVPSEDVVQETELFIRCPLRGLLEWQPAFSFIRSFSINGNVVNARRRVMVPGANAQPGEAYEVAMLESGFNSVHNSAPDLSQIPIRLRASERDRQRNEEAERLGQKWFHRSRQEATAFVRELIGSARERVWIVDPYFATVELFSFALATTRSDVEVTILTSALALAAPDPTLPAREAGNVLLASISGRPETARIKVLVMTGDSPTVHDRFLVIDRAVWFTGNSLNSLGERAGMMISLPAPDVVVTKLEGIMSDTQRSRPLADWVAQRQANRAA